MTGIYEWYSFPDKLSIVCPDCTKHADFERAKVVQIKLKKDIEYFRSSKVFEYHSFKGYAGHKCHGAVFYPGLQSRFRSGIEGLPEGYQAEDWLKGRSLKEEGTVICSSCNCRRKYRLNWPHDAYYQISYKSDVLWALDRMTLDELIDYVASEERNVSEFRHQYFLRHVPKLFLGKGARQEVVKRLRKVRKGK